MKISRVLFIFILFSFLGWWLEYFNELIFFKKFNPQYSLLLGKRNKIPLLPIYGGGFFILYFLANQCYENDISLLTTFISVTVVLTIFELLMGIIAELIFKKRAWDYSKYSSYHILGYIDILHSLAWGFISTIIIYTIIFFKC